MAKKSPDPVDRHVGARIRMRRLMLTFSQTKLADTLGLTFQQVQKYEKGVNRVSASRLQHIASFLQVPVSFFFEGTPINRNEDANNFNALSPEYVTAFLSSTDGLHLVRAFTRISNRALRRSVVKLVEQIAVSAQD